MDPNFATFSLEKWATVGVIHLKANSKTFSYPGVEPRFFLEGEQEGRSMKISFGGEGGDSVATTFF